MLPENIDDLFRQQLDGHATPPAPDLWARLQLPAADADPVDAVFQDGLRGHASPPRRELWERLEDEHLRPQPRRRRAVAWWQLSAAAVLLLGLLLGGGLLWRGSNLGGASGGIARSHISSGRGQANQPTTATPGQPSLTLPQPTAQVADLAGTGTATPKENQEISATRATAAHAFTSSTPIATTTRPRRTATTPQAGSGHHVQRSQPDAAASTLAWRGRQNTPASQSPAATAPAAGAARPTDAPVLAVAPAAPATTPQIIEVEVRRGPTSPAATPAAVVAATDAPATPTRRRGLRLGGLLRQADHLVHGEPVSLAEATGLPEAVTLQARLGGRVVSKTIQL